ncbi:RraA family protein [Polynucleobacter sinensis]|uniref:RraA family protein n=1 Tax=Polynucleobacter sinensis TaxID=1743157 RepID=UPI000780F52C|nr:methyltransferase [Polynucleobacter sinensis]
MTTPNIIKDFPRVSKEIIAQAAQFQPAILADVADRRGALHGRISALRPHMKVAGPALTVEVRAGDNLMIHAAMSLAKPGDVLVIDGKGDLTAALMGAIMINACKKLGIAGVVIDGAIRDTLELEALDFPVFSVGANPNGPTKQVSGRIGHPISVGDVAVAPGDFIIGDADGVVAVEREKIASLIPLAKEKVEAEEKRIASIKTGNTAAPWLNSALVNAGVIKPGETL